MKRIYLSTATTDNFSYFTVNVNGDKTNSVFIDFHLLSDSIGDEKSDIQKLTDYIYPLLEFRNYNDEQRKVGLNCTLTNLLSANAEGKYLAISKSNNHYYHSSFYGIPHYTFAYIVKPINKLHELGFVKQHNGHHSHTNGANFRTRISATQKLLNLAASIFTEQTLTIDEIEYVQSKTNVDFLIKNNLPIDKKRRYPYHITLIVGSKDNKRRIPFNVDENIQKITDFLTKYNEFLDKNIISFPLLSSYSLNSKDHHLYPSFPLWRSHLAKFNPSPLLVRDSGLFYGHQRLDTYLFRVFSRGSFELGGRFYNRGYQKYNSELRRYLRINGYPIIELDFSAYHINMIYHKSGIEYQGDPYSDVLGKLYRNLIKKVSFIAINSKNEKCAEYTLKEVLQKEEELNILFVTTGLTEKELFQKFGEHHYQIADFLHSKKAWQFNSKIHVLLKIY